MSVTTRQATEEHANVASPEQPSQSAALASSKGRVILKTRTLRDEQALHDVAQEDKLERPPDMQLRRERCA